MQTRTFLTPVPETIHGFLIFQEKRTTGNNSNSVGKHNLEHIHARVLAQTYTHMHKASEENGLMK